MAIYAGMFAVLVLVYALIEIVKYGIKARETIIDGKIFIILVLICISFCCLGCKYSTSYTQYQVTISDNVNFNEFNNKYKIISQDGKIYTVEERK